MDAYTLRKIAPRILVGVIAMNLSIYLCLAAISVANIVGGGLFNLITAPFDTASFGAANQGQTAGGILSLIGLISGTALATYAIWGFLGIFAVLGVGVLWALVILGVLVFRQGLLVLLTILSPVAIALWLMPGTEKYFQMWWDWFFKALLVYPIVASLFAISNVLTTIYIDDASGSSSANNISLIIALIVAFAPLFLIPFAFKLSGGIIGGVSGALRRPMAGLGAGARGFAGARRKKIWNDPFTLRGSSRRSVQSKVANTRAKIYDNAVKNREGKGVRGRAGKLIGGKYSSYRAAALNEESAKLNAMVQQHGNDAYQRAATISLDQLDNMRGGPRHQFNKATQQDEWQTASGDWYNEGEIRAAHSQMRTTGDYQAAFRHTLSKTENQDAEHQAWLAHDFAQHASQAGMSAGQAAGDWAGISIPNKHIVPHLRFGNPVRGDDGNWTFQANAGAYLEHLGTASPGQLTSISEGGWQAAADQFNNDLAQLARYESDGNTEQADIVRDRLQAAHDNIERFAGGARQLTPEQEQQVRQQATATGQDPDAAVRSYGAGESASAKSHQAARKALEAIKASGSGTIATGPGQTSERRTYGGGVESRSDDNAPQDPEPTSRNTR